jgi:hypothetical protein
MLLSSPSFSDLLNEMSNNPALVNQASQIQPQPAPQQQEQQPRQPPKDVNPYTASLQHQQQQMGTAMVNQGSSDFANIGLENEPNNFILQPQVFTLSTPELIPSIDVTMLSGKSSNFVGEQLDADDDKVQLPVIERPAEKSLSAPEQPPHPVDPEFESNPEFELYHTPTSPVSAADEEEAWKVNVFGGVQPEKVLARYELVDASEEEQCALLALEKVQRTCERLEATRVRIEELLDA